MDFLIYLISLLLTTIAGFVGLLIAHNSAEELRPGKRYFGFAERSVIILLFIIYFLFFQFDIIPFMVLAVLVIAMLVVNRYVFSAMVLGIVLAFFVKDELAFFLAASLIMIFFFITASTLYRAYLEKHIGFRKLSLTLLMNSALFLAVGLAGFFIYTH
ncbi:MAG: hypothetical protein V1743_01430 [Nanoarchaeota archaeon]